MSCIYPLISTFVKIDFVTNFEIKEEEKWFGLGMLFDE